MHDLMELERQGFCYSPETGRPTFDGEPVLGLTDVLKLAGIMDGSSFGTDYDLWMGRCRHAAVELWVKGTLDLKTLDPAVAPSLEAFLRFQDDTGFQPTHSEYPCWNPVYRVATKIDLLGVFPDKTEAIIELKSGVCAKPTAIQTALQDMLLDEQKTRKRFGLSIPKTGKPNVSPYTDRDDYSIARSAMNIAVWKVRNLGSKF